jgi:hypothetical protein
MVSDRKSESVYYEDDNVRVSSSRLIVSGQTYAMRHITSVSMKSVPPKNPFLYYLLVYPGIPIFIVFLGVGAWVVAALGAAMTAAGFWFAMKTPEEYAVLVSLSNAEKHVLQRPDKKVIGEIVQAISEAIATGN